MALSVAPCITVGEETFSKVLDCTASSFVVRWGATGVEGKDVCTREEMDDIDAEVCVVWFDLIEAVSDTDASSFLRFVAELDEETGFGIEIPKVPKTLFAVLRLCRFGKGLRGVGVGIDSVTKSSLPVDCEVERGFPFIQDPIQSPMAVLGRLGLSVAS